MLACKYGQLKTAKSLAEPPRVITVESELMLGDEYPEIEKVHICRGYLSEITGEKTEEGWLALSGRIEVHLVYRAKETEAGVAEYGAVWKGEKSIPFTAEIELPEAADIRGWQAEIIKSELEPGSERTVRYKGAISINLQARQERQIPVVTELAVEDGIKTVTERVVVEEVIAVLEGRRELSNQFSLAHPREPLARVVDCRVRPVAAKTEISPGRVKVDGHLETVLLYVGRDDDGEETELEVARWHEKNGGAVPFQIVFEEPRALPEQTARTEVRVKSFAMQSPHAESCNLQAVLEARVELVEPCRREMVVDVTAEKERIIDVDRGEYQIEETVGEIEKDFQMEKILSLPAGALPVGRILLVDNSPPQTVDAQVEADRVFFEGECGMTILYSEEHGEIDELERPSPQIAAVNWEDEPAGTIKFAEFLEMPGVAPGMAARVTLEERGITAELIDERTIKVNLALRARAAVSEERTLSLVRDCALVPVPEKPRTGMLFYLIQPGDTLWSIARRYQTTVDALCRANDLSGPGAEVLPGKKLLIPKTPLPC
ncbi:MAG: DUF3794 domain-containing protein [Firmicutes bacterium]|nr:DUF3794 domain-containing protein [Bacillota bacterium]